MFKKIHQQYLASFRGLSREVWLLALLMFINRSGSMVIPFLSVYLSQQLNFSLDQVGWVMGAFGFGSLVGVYIGGFLTDKFGPYKVQFWSLLIAGIMLFMLQLMDTFLQFTLMIFLTSVIMDAFRPANMTAVAFYSKKEDQTRSISLIRLAINAGWGIGPAIGGLIAANMGYNWLFWVDGITCILAALFLLSFLKPQKGMSGEKETKSKTEIKKNIFKDYAFLIFLALNTITMLVFFQLFSTLPVYYKTSLSLNEDHIGLIMAMNGLIIAATEMPLVYIFEKRFHSLKIIVFGTMLITLAYTVYLLGSWPGLAIFSMLIITFGEIFHMPFANAFTIGRADKEQMGKYLSYYGMSFSLAFIFAPVIGMQIADAYGYNVLWIFMTIIGLIAGFGFLFLYKYVNSTKT